MTQQLQSIIDAAWEDRANISVKSASRELTEAVEHVIAGLNSGKLRVATREGVGQWTTHQWIKKAVLLSFRLKDNAVVKAGDLGFYDKVQTKFAHLDDEAMKETGGACGATGCRTSGKLPRQGRDSDALVCQHWRVRR